jgi:hypothetical protein
VWYHVDTQYLLETVGLHSVNDNRKVCGKRPISYNEYDIVNSYAYVVQGPKCLSMQKIKKINSYIPSAAEGTIMYPGCIQLLLLHILLSSCTAKCQTYMWHLKF